MLNLAAVQATQTMVLAIVAGALIYVMSLLRNEMRGAADAIKRTIDSNAENKAALDRAWLKIGEIEGKAAQPNDRAALGEWVGRAWQHIEKIEARLEALEKGEPPPMGTRPTDPPLGS